MVSHRPISDGPAFRLLRRWHRRTARPGPARPRWPAPLPASLPPPTRPVGCCARFHAGHEHHVPTTTSRARPVESHRETEWTIGRSIFKTGSPLLPAWPRVGTGCHLDAAGGMNDSRRSIDVPGIRAAGGALAAGRHLAQERPAGHIACAGAWLASMSQRRSADQHDTSLRAVAPEFPGLPDDPPPLEFQVSDPDVLRRRLTDAGLKEVRVERTVERPAFASGQEMWDWVLYEPDPGRAGRGSERGSASEIAPGPRRHAARALGTTGRAVT